MTGEDNIEREKSGRRGEGEDKRRALQRSELCAYKSCLFALIFFSPESSFYPGLNGITSILDVQSDNLADAIPDESQFEDEDDWIDIPSVGNASQVHPSKFSEAVANEVSSQYLTVHSLYGRTHRDQSGRSHIPQVVRHLLPLAVKGLVVLTRRLGQVLL